MTRNLSALATALLLGLLASATPAWAAKPKATFTITGAGYGHGVGMSQYGALGYAEHGATASDILAHYYTGTSLGTTDPNRIVRVQLIARTGAATIAGAVQAGDRNLDPTVTYKVKRHGLNQLDLLDGSKRLATFTAPLQVAGQAGVTLLGGRGYRGTLELSPGLFGGVTVIDAVGLDDYVQGVVPVESPASWPAEALKAQAIAARTYAITTSRGGDFDQYADTRSQMYGGVSVETPATNAAVSATRGQVVTYAGQPVVTYFFSTSGGRTENVENTPLGSQPEPWLKSVDDPYDNLSPRHRWTPETTSLASIAKKLRGLYQGAFRGIKVLERGVSPRIMSAQVIGTRGSTTTDGATLRDRLGLFDTWAYFRTVTGAAKPPTGQDGSPPTQASAPSGGAQAARLAARPAGVLVGTVVPGARGAVAVVQALRGGSWKDVGAVHLGRGGAYRWVASAAGSYRVVYAGAAGPAIAVSGPR
jgi:stage II sporulation protein D